jgi:hypothetical protein
MLKVKQVKAPRRAGGDDSLDTGIIFYAWGERPEGKSETTTKKRSRETKIPPPQNARRPI